jgi:amino acid transporter
VAFVPDRWHRGDAAGVGGGKARRSLPSSGGIVTFLIQGFGKGHISAITSWLRYFAALIVTGMVSVSFGNYASALFFGESSSPGWSKVLATAVVLAVAAVNIARARFIDRVQSAIVVVLLAVFAIFMVVTLAQTNPQLLARRPTRRQWT